MTKKTLQAKALRAFKEAIYEVIEQHKRAGRPLAVWRNGKVIKIPARQALRKAIGKTRSS